MWDTKEIKDSADNGGGDSVGGMVWVSTEPIPLNRAVVFYNTRYHLPGGSKTEAFCGNWRSHNNIGRCRWVNLDVLAKFQWDYLSSSYFNSPCSFNRMKHSFSLPALHSRVVTLCTNVFHPRGSCISTVGDVTPIYVRIYARIVYLSIGQICFPLLSYSHSVFMRVGINDFVEL